MVHFEWCLGILDELVVVEWLAYIYFSNRLIRGCGSVHVEYDAKPFVAL